MNAIREAILMDVAKNQYRDFDKYNDMIGFVVGAECFEDEDVDRYADFAELEVIVERPWLFSKMLAEGIANPRAYLREEYTSDDSYEWYADGIRERKVVMVAFNGESED